jgi:hypothetical protein
MARTQISVDRTRFLQAVQTAEHAGPLPHLNALYHRVATLYNVGEGIPITPNVVPLRLKQWAIPTVTQVGKATASTTPTSLSEPDCRFMLKVATPAGEPPVRLSGYSLEEIGRWINQTQAALRPKKQWYAASCFIYFVQHYYVDQFENPTLYQEIVATIENYFHQEQVIA